MSTSAEQDAVRAIIGSLKANVSNLADHIEAMPLTPDLARQQRKMIELRFALIAVVEAAIEDGTPAGSAFLAFRDLGATGWGLKLFVQYAGQVPTRTVAQDGQNVVEVLADAAGAPMAISASYSEADPIPHSTVRH